MRKLMSVVMLLLVIFAVFTVTEAHATMTPLEVAEKAADYVISQAIAEGGGYKWEWESPYGLIAYESQVLWGSSGVGTFFLKLYERTGNSTYLEYAKGAAQWLITQAFQDSGGYKWAHIDDSNPSPGWWLTSMVSGIGGFLLNMYQTTGNSTYLDYAEGAAQWMTAMAESESGGYFVPYNPPGKYGSQASFGIMPGREAHTVAFLLQLYQETSNSTYLFYVKAMADWLISGPDIREENGGYKWAHNRPYYYPQYFIAYGYGGGTVEVATFFYEAYQALGNTTYLQYANGAMQWILSQAVPVDSDKVKWPVLQGGSDYQVVIGDPPTYNSFAVVSDVLLKGYLVTHNSTYLEYAEKQANWIATQTPLENAYYNAELFRFFIDMYNIAGDIRYSQSADTLLSWIIGNATFSNGGFGWKTLDYYAGYPAWFSPGASGIGYNLISALSTNALYQLTVTSTPLTGIPFTINAVSKTTPYTESLPEGYYTVEMPQTYNGYKWSKWLEDGDTNLSKTVTMNTNITLTAVFLPLPPLLSVAISPLSASILIGQSVTFTSTVSGGYTPYSYQWYLNGNPVSGATSNTWTFTPVAGGIYYIHLKVTDAKANTAQSETARIVVATVPVGGYSFPIQVHTKTEPVLPYIALIATLTAIFTTLKSRIKRRKH